MCFLFIHTHISPAPFWKMRKKINYFFHIFLIPLWSPLNVIIFFPTTRAHIYFWLKKFLIFFVIFSSNFPIWGATYSTPHSSWESFFSRFLLCLYHQKHTPSFPFFSTPLKNVCVCVWCSPFRHTHTHISNLINVFLRFKLEENVVQIFFFDRNRPVFNITSFILIVLKIWKFEKKETENYSPIAAGLGRDILKKGIFSDFLY